MAYDIYFPILVLFVVSAIAIGVLGSIRRIPLFLVVSGILWFVLFIAVDNVVVGEKVNNMNTTSFISVTNHMNQPTSNAVSILRNGVNHMVGEEVVNDNSVLNMKEINQATVRLDKDGMPTGYIYVGVWNSIVNPTPTNYKFLIGQIVANYTDGTGATYTFTRNDTKTYFLSVNDVVGIFYNGGSSGNQINIAYNTTVSSFDGSNSYRTSFSGSGNTWVDSSTQDIRGKISLSKTNIQEITRFDDVKQDIGFTTNQGAQIKLFFLIFAIGFMFFGALEQKYGI